MKHTYLDPKTGKSITLDDTANDFNIRSQGLEGQGYQLQRDTGAEAGASTYDATVSGRGVVVPPKGTVAPNIPTDTSGPTQYVDAQGKPIVNAPREGGFLSRFATQPEAVTAPVTPAPVTPEGLYGKGEITAAGQRAAQPTAPTPSPVQMPSPLPGEVKTAGVGEGVVKEPGTMNVNDLSEQLNPGYSLGLKGEAAPMGGGEARPQMGFGGDAEVQQRIQNIGVPGSLGEPDLAGLAPDPTAIPSPAPTVPPALEQGDYRKSIAGEDYLNKFAKPPQPIQGPPKSLMSEQAPEAKLNQKDTDKAQLQNLAAAPGAPTPEALGIQGDQSQQWADAMPPPAQSGGGSDETWLRKHERDLGSQPLPRGTQNATPSQPASPSTVPSGTIPSAPMGLSGAPTDTAQAESGAVAPQSYGPTSQGPWQQQQPQQEVGGTRDPSMPDFGAGLRGVLGTPSTSTGGTTAAAGGAQEEPPVDLSKLPPIPKGAYDLSQKSSETKTIYDPEAKMKAKDAAGAYENQAQQGFEGIKSRMGEIDSARLQRVADLAQARGDSLKNYMADLNANEQASFISTLVNSLGKILVGGYDLMGGATTAGASQYYKSPEGFDKKGADALAKEKYGANVEKLEAVEKDEQAQDKDWFDSATKLDSMRNTMNSQIYNMAKEYMDMTKTLRQQGYDMKVFTPADIALLSDKRYYEWALEKMKQAHEAALAALDNANKNIRSQKELEGVLAKMKETTGSKQQESKMYSPETHKAAVADMYAVSSTVNDANLQRLKGDPSTTREYTLADKAWQVWKATKTPESKEAYTRAMDNFITKVITNVSNPGNTNYYFPYLDNNQMAIKKDAVIRGLQNASYFMRVPDERVDKDNPLFINGVDGITRLGPYFSMQASQEGNPYFGYASRTSGEEQSRGTSRTVPAPPPGAKQPPAGTPTGGTTATPTVTPGAPSEEIPPVTATPDAKKPPVTPAGGATAPPETKPALGGHRAGPSNVERSKLAAAAKKQKQPPTTTPKAATEAEWKALVAKAKANKGALSETDAARFQELRKALGK